MSHVALYKGPGFASVRAPRALNCALLTVACGFMAGAKRSVHLKTHVHCGELIAPPVVGCNVWRQRETQSHRIGLRQSCSELRQK